MECFDGIYEKVQSIYEGYENKDFEIKEYFDLKIPVLKKPGDIDVLGHHFVLYKDATKDEYKEQTLVYKYENVILKIRILTFDEYKKLEKHQNNIIRYEEKMFPIKNWKMKGFLKTIKGRYYKIACILTRFFEKSLNRILIDGTGSCPKIKDLSKEDQKFVIVNVVDAIGKFNYDCHKMGLYCIDELVRNVTITMIDSIWRLLVIDEENIHTTKDKKKVIKSCEELVNEFFKSVFDIICEDYQMFLFKEAFLRIFKQLMEDGNDKLYSEQFLFITDLFLTDNLESVKSKRTKRVNYKDM